MITPIIGYNLINITAQNTVVVGYWQRRRVTPLFEFKFVRLLKTIASEQMLLTLLLMLLMTA